MKQSFPSFVVKKIRASIPGAGRRIRSHDKQHFDIIIAGGGIIGAAVGYGLAKKGCSVAILDAPPILDRASRSNMGLIWSQSKALGCPEYARLGFLSSRLFPALGRELLDTSGIDIVYSPSGGIIPCLGEEDFNQRSQYIDDLGVQSGGDYPGMMISREELEKKLPRINFGDQVVGGAFCEGDGFVEPLKLLFALRQGMVNLGGSFLNNSRVTGISRENKGYVVKTAKNIFSCERLVLAGGMGNRQLASHFDLKVPVQPTRGQVLLTERVGDILPIPLLGITRTPGGTVIVGFMHENVGMDTGLVPESLAKEASWAVSVWPAIANLRVIRCWSSLRVMPRDGYPVYDTIPGHSNAFLINTHSAVTLAAVHAKTLPDFVLGKGLPLDQQIFGLSRFKNIEVKKA